MNFKGKIIEISYNNILRKFISKKLLKFSIKNKLNDKIDKFCTNLASK